MISPDAIVIFFLEIRLTARGTDVRRYRARTRLPGLGLIATREENTRARSNHNI